MNARMTIRILPALLLAWVCVHGFAADTTVPQPLDVGPDVSLYVAIPDLSAAIDTIEVVGKQFNPNLQGGQIKNALGLSIGDPALANLDTSKPLVAMMFKAPAAAANAPPPFALYIPAKAAAPYDQVAQAAQLLSSYKDGVLIVSKTQDALTLAENQLPIYKKVADAKIASEARIYFSFSNLLSTYGPQIKMMLPFFQQGFQQGFANSPGGKRLDPKVLAKILGLELKGLMEFLDETDSEQIDLSIRKDSVSADTLVVAKKGTPLADLFSSPPSGPGKALRVLTSAGLVAGAIRLNKNANVTFSTKVLDTLSKDPDAADLITADVKKLIADAVAVQGDDLAVSLSPAAEGPFKLQEAIAITDEKKYLEIHEQLARTIMGPDGIFGKLYGNLGVQFSVDFEKDVRKHGAVAVNRYKYKFDTANLPPQQAAEMKLFTKDLEMAIVNGLVLLAQDPSDLDKMIDKAQAGEGAKPDVSLESITVFGGGKQAYMDIDFIALMKAAVTAMPANPAAGMFAQLKASGAMLLAGSYDSGRVLMQMKIPLAPFVELVTIGRNMRGGGKAPPPAPAPDPKNEKF